MSLKKAEQLKGDKGFKRWDLIIYAALAALIVAAAIGGAATANNSPLTGIRISVGDDTVFEYYFGNNSYKVYDGCVEVTENGGSLSLYITCGGGYNVVEIGEGKVRVTQADCFSKTCVKTPDIEDNSSFIYCSAHNLKIQPIDFEPKKEVPIG